MDVEIYRKHTSTDTHTVFTSHLTIQQDIKWLLTDTVYTEWTHFQYKKKKLEMGTSLQITKNNGYPQHLNIKLNSDFTNKIHQILHNENPQTKQAQTCATYTYHSQLIRTITNLFRHTPIHIASKAINTLFTQLNTRTQTTDGHTNSGVYKLASYTCEISYPVKTCTSVKARFSSHNRHKRTNNPKSAYELHILKIDTNTDPFRIT